MHYLELKQILLIFLDQICFQELFSVQRKTNKHHYQIQHHSKLFRHQVLTQTQTVFNFSPKLAQNKHFWSKTEQITNKIKTKYFTEIFSLNFIIYLYGV